VGLRRPAAAPVAFIRTVSDAVRVACSAADAALRAPSARLSEPQAHKLRIDDDVQIRPQNQQ
jgi:hypothetical protein